MRYPIPLNTREQNSLVYARDVISQVGRGLDKGKQADLDRAWMAIQNVLLGRLRVRPVVQANESGILADMEWIAGATGA
jgi:hypothetical protein